MISEIFDFTVIPAIVGITISIVGIAYSLNKKSINNALLKNNRLGFITSTVAILISGFLVQNLINHLEDIEQFSHKHKDIIDIPLILSALFSGTVIFIGNRILRNSAINKEKTEISVFLTNVIESQVEDLSYINFYITDTDVRLEENLERIKFYNQKINNNDKYYPDAFKKMGLYENTEIDVISKYFKKLQDIPSYNARFLSEFSEAKKYQGIKDYSVSEYEITFIILKIEISMTILLGFLSIYVLSDFNQKQEIETKLFVEKYYQVISDLRCLFDFSKFYVLDQIIAEDLIKILEYVKNAYQARTENINNQEKENIFICRLSIINNDNNNPIPLLQQRNIIAFEKTNESVENKAKCLLKHEIKKHLNFPDQDEYKNYFNNLELTVEVKLVSPWNKL
jgi:hypothetical protein